MTEETSLIEAKLANSSLKVGIHDKLLSFLFPQRFLETKVTAEAVVTLTNNVVKKLSEGESNLNPLEREFLTKWLAVNSKQRANVFEIISKAYSDLGEGYARDGEGDSDPDVDDDWVARFASDCKDVSADAIQGIYAKILAQKIRDPSEVSTSSLAALRYLDAETARWFMSVCKVLLRTDDGTLFILPYERRTCDSYGGLGLTYDSLLALDEHRMLRTGRVRISLDFHLRGRMAMARVKCGTGQVAASFLVDGERSLRDVCVPGYVLTRAGRQIAAALDGTVDSAFFRLLQSEFLHHYIALDYEESSPGEKSKSVPPRPGRSRAQTMPRPQEEVMPSLGELRGMAESYARTDTRDAPWMTTGGFEVPNLESADFDGVDAALADGAADDGRSE